LLDLLLHFMICHCRSAIYPTRLLISISEPSSIFCAAGWPLMPLAALFWWKRLKGRS
jgi:hypothetical protein